MHPVCAATFPFLVSGRRPREQRAGGGGCAEDLQPADGGADEVPEPGARGGEWGQCRGGVVWALSQG